METKEQEMNKGVTLSRGFIETLGCLCIAEENREQILGILYGVLDLARLIDDYEVLKEAKQLIWLLHTV